MTKKTFLIYKIITAITLGIVVGVSVNLNNWYLPVICFVAFSVFLLSLRRKVNEVLADERDYRVAGRASYAAIMAYVWIAVIIGIILITTGRGEPVLFAIGYTLLYSACFLMVFYGILFKILIKRDERD